MQLSSATSNQKEKFGFNNPAAFFFARSAPPPLFHRTYAMYKK